MTDKPNNKDDLLPCPFCGETPEYSKHFKENIWQMLHRCKVIGPISIGWMSRKESIAEQWNKRVFVVTPETVKKMQCCGNCKHSDTYYHTFCQTAAAHTCRTNTGNPEHEDHWRFIKDETKADS